MQDHDQTENEISSKRFDTGVLLVNLGSPDKPEIADVRRYLKQFLMDGRVIDLPAWARWLLVHLIILPTRPRRSAAAYQKVWTADGSPLIVEGERLASGVAKVLEDDYLVKLGMRYGNPSIEKGLKELIAEGCDRIIVVPLYPQYASATTGSINEEIMRLMKQEWNMPEIVLMGDFYDDPLFIEAFADVGRAHLDPFKPDHVLFSYHGLPKRHLLRGDQSGKHCQIAADCCAKIGPHNRFCYRAQCVASTEALATALGLSRSDYDISFQSRLGRAEWIRPYTDDVVEDLLKKGKKRLAVMCPAFVADCLETIEEIGMELKEQWLEGGGEDFCLVPSLNSNKLWLQNLSTMIRTRY